MEVGNVKPASLFRRLDWFTIGLYAALLVLGWISVCCAIYEFGQPDFFDFGLRSGKQLRWICCSVALAFILLMLDEKVYDTFAYFIYVAFMLLLLVTPFIASDVKGSLSWIKFGSISLQPAEFAKCATALALAKFMGTYGFDLRRMGNFFKALGLVLLPMTLIVLQKETGSALVYLSFFLMFYREGMNGSVLFAGFAAVLFFVVGVRFSNEYMTGTETSVGEFSVLLLVWFFTAAMTFVTIPEKVHSIRIAAFGGAAALLSYLFSRFVVPFNVGYALLIIISAVVVYLIVEALYQRKAKLAVIACFAVISTAFFYSTDYVMNNVLKVHQQQRVKVLLGIEQDLSGAGYNVNQSKIAIGSGGLLGKGLLNGTQTKLKFVPEQDTDFIFCTVGEEKGFLGAGVVLLLYLTLILRLVHLAERQTSAFGRIYGYCVLSIFLFHVFINVGMVIGLTPVIGIPLPFFSYGGSSLWGFTLLLFIFLRIDASRKR